MTEAEEVPMSAQAGDGTNAQAADGVYALLGRRLHDRDPAGPGR
jgi:hypothetical protein